MENEKNYYSSQQLKHKELLEKWKESRPNYNYFTNDGILKYENFANQNPKILFLLKESNSDFINISPINENSLGHGPKGNSNTFWRYMRGYEHVINCAWNKKDLNLNETLKIKESPNINTAYVNIKKQCDNKSNSSDQEIIKFAKTDKEFLLKQIEIISPDIIFCGGTLEPYIILESNLIKVNTKVYRSNHYFVIDFYHLAHRKGYKTFQELFDVLKDVKFDTPTSRFSIKSKKSNDSEPFM